MLTCLQNILPTSKKLWTPEEGLQSVVTDTGKSIPLSYQEPIQNKSGNVVFVTDQDLRKNLFDTMTVKQNITDTKGRILVSNVPAIIDREVKKMIANKAVYQSISGTFPNPIRWYHVALIHKMEGDLNFNTYLGNGQVLSKKTTIVPIGRGPFNSFNEGAIDALKLDRLNVVQDWSIGNTLYILEGFNGYGYYLYRHINSPYLWSGTNHYQSGYYIKDGVYSASTVSQQVGIAPMFKRLLELI